MHKHEQQTGMIRERKEGCDKRQASSSREVGCAIYVAHCGVYAAACMYATVCMQLSTLQLHEGSTATHPNFV